MDLIERLRRGDASFYYATMNEAADEIERLQRENEELRVYLAQARNDFAELAALKAQSTEQPVAWLFKSPLGFKKLQLEKPILDNPAEHNWNPLYLAPPTATALVSDFKRRAMNVEVAITYMKQEETNAFVAGLNAYHKAIESLPLIGEKHE